MNRFSKDQGILDQLIMPVLHDILSCCITALASVVTVCIVAPILIPPCVFLAILFFGIQFFYRCTVRELKRLKSISYSGIFSVAAETATGLSVLRAFKNERQFTTAFNHKLDINTQFIFNEFAVNRWLNMQLECIAGVVVFLAAAASILLMKSLGSGLVGLIVTTALSMCGSLAWGVRQLSQMEVNMNSVERILHYCSSVPQETTVSSLPPPPDSWPASGTVVVSDLVVQYRPDLDPVLRGISCSIKSGEKIGVVGRTGAGKSTLTSAIFRMVDASAGSILIDGVNIYDVQLDVLRSALAIIPQDPVLFSGSIRLNLDPFGKHSDEELWSVLTHIHLDKHVQKLNGHLDYHFKDTGEGFSVGQRQLLCIGRAILRNAKILVMDEATASLDFNTDLLIKKTVRECFASKTTITIAHRLDTIMDSDRVMVFEQGKLVEFENPAILLANPTSEFSKLVAAARKSFKNASSRS
eukprot:Phypoly_transcript_08211.p1 GENE.Phypoly_transcript_08211~~Phypoly_transcript_08211.p1  ORF type:complete len:494 (+),score=50.90 Phypoly_transcript_08211:78-1484(+)